MDYTKIFHTYRPMTNRAECSACHQTAEHKSHDEALRAAIIARNTVKAQREARAMDKRRMAGHCRTCGTYIEMSDSDTKAGHREGWACRESED